MGIKGKKNIKGEGDLYVEKKKRVGIALTPEASAHLKTKAEEADLSVSEYIERIARSPARPELSAAPEGYTPPAIVDKKPIKTTLKEKAMSTQAAFINFVKDLSEIVSSVKAGEISFSDGYHQLAEFYSFWADKCVHLDIDTMTYNAGCNSLTAAFAAIEKFDSSVYTR